MKTHAELLIKIFLKTFSFSVEDIKLLSKLGFGKKLNNWPLCLAYAYQVSSKSVHSFPRFRTNFYEILRGAVLKEF